MYRSAAPEFFEDDYEPETEPHGQLVPPRRGPPTAIGVEEPETPSSIPPVNIYPRRLLTMTRIARFWLAGVPVFAIGWLYPRGTTPVAWTILTGCCALVLMYAVITAEGVEHALRREYRWARRRLNHRRTDYHIAMVVRRLFMKPG